VDDQDRSAFAALMEHAPEPGENPVDPERAEALAGIETEHRVTRRERRALAADADWVT
jgi:hypothetical protein